MGNLNSIIRSFPLDSTYAKMDANPMPLKMGVMAQMWMAPPPDPANCPTASSRKYIGNPIRRKTTKYGIKNAPNTNHSTNQGINI
jgi:hypothetical protein